MPRVISGSAGGHRLKTIKGIATRPTSDKVKESIFNIIASDISGHDVLDAFAGTGGLGIEALSRGANSAVFLDNSARCCGVIRENLLHTKLSDFAEVYCIDYVSAIEQLSRKGRKFDLILLDPPYYKKFIPKALKILTDNDIIRDNSVVIAEHSVTDSVPASFEGLEAVDSRKYGDTMITVYKWRRSDAKGNKSVSQGGK